MSTVAFFETRLSLIAKMQSMCTSKEVVKMRTDELVAACLDKLTTMGPQSVTDVLSLTELVEKASVSPAVKSTFIESLATNFGAGPQPQDAWGLAYPKFQIHEHIHHYLIKHEWIQAADEAKPVPMRILGLVRAMHRCGWVRHSEPQLAHVAGTLGP